jgi:protein-tyrosine kinase
MRTLHTTTDVRRDTPWHRPDDKVMLRSNEESAPKVPERERHRTDPHLLTPENVLHSASVRESLRHLYDQLLAAGPDRGGTYSITSAVAGEGKTVVALSLARLMADDLEKRIVIIDGNLRTPEVHRVLGVPLLPGLAGCIRRECSVREAAREVNGLWVLPAGGDPNPSRLLRSAAARSTVDEIREAFDVAILDLPALLSTSEARVMAGWTDGVVIVIRADSTPAPAVLGAIESIERQKMLGVVLNEQMSRIPKWLDRLL